MANDSLRMAQALADNGLTDGQHFGICGHNNYEYVITLFGGLILGAVAVPINSQCSLGKHANREHQGYQVMFQL